MINLRYTYINIKMVQFENFGGRCFISNETEYLKISSVPLYCPHFVSEIENFVG